MPRCTAVKSDGSPCQAIVKGEQQRCYSHNPDNAKARSKTASKAASSRYGGEIPSIKRDLRTMAEDVVSGKLATARGSVAGQLLGILLKCIEQERRQRELEELVARVEELEVSLETQRQEGGSWYYGS
jgi:hypothetical protein